MDTKQDSPPGMPMRTGVKAGVDQVSFDAVKNFSEDAAINQIRGSVDTFFTQLRGFFAGLFP